MFRRRFGISKNENDTIFCLARSELLPLHANTLPSVLPKMVFTVLFVPCGNVLGLDQVP